LAIAVSIQTSGNVNISALRDAVSQVRRRGGEQVSRSERQVRLDHASKFSEQAIAGVLYGAAAVLPDPWLNERREMCFQLFRSSSPIRRE
jgi:hypothetical protein